MGELIDVFNDSLGDWLKKLSNSLNAELNSTFVQYIHISRCETSCSHCRDNDLRIFLNNNDKPKVGEENHKWCDCVYQEVEELEVGSISNKGLDAPDVWIRAYGVLPGYYITKEIAETEYGWNGRRNTVSGKAPGKMIGGDVYENDKNKLPVADGRVWYECDVDYVSGARNSKRLFYSNDGLIFYSPDHGEREFYYIK